MSCRPRRFSCGRGSFSISGVQYIPEGENLPIVIISHEFLVGKFSVERYARRLAGWGYAAFCYDFVGGGLFGGSGGSHKDMTVLTEKEDLRAVLEYAKSCPETDPSKAYLFGCSQGGLVSALVAAELNDEISGLILFYPALSVPDDARAGSMIFKTGFDPRNVPDTIKCGPFSFSGEYPRSVMGLNVFDEIAKYKGRVFIAHGDADKIVDAGYSKKAQKVYTRERCSLMLIPGAGHIFAPVQDRPALAGIANFLDGRREILRIDVSITGISPRLSGIRSTMKIRFGGSAAGDFFEGVILPGAVDTQTRTGFATERLCAEYTLEGRDYMGAKCRIHIRNTDEGEGWKPAVSTDSEALSFLNRAGCRAYVAQRGLKGPLVRIFA